MKKIKIAGIIFLASGLAACSGVGGSSSGGDGNTPQVRAQLSIDAMTSVPVVNGSATKGTLYIHNYGTVAASGLNFGLNNATTRSKLKSTLASMGFKLKGSLLNQDGFTLINPELCTSIPAGGSCAINFSTPGLVDGDRGNSLVTLNYKSNGSSLTTNQVVNYQYVSLSALNGVNFSGSLNVGGAWGSTQHVVGYLYGGGASGSKYQNVTLASSSTATTISNGFIDGQEVAAGQVIAVELAVNMQDNQNSAVNVVPYWSVSKLSKTKKSTQATTSGNSGGMLSLTITPSQNTVNYIFGAIPILTAPTTTAAVINVTNNGNAASNGGLTATSSDTALTITNTSCASTVLLANAANSCTISFSVAGYTPGSATVTFKDNNGATVGTQTVIWANDTPVPAVYILPNQSTISFGKGIPIPESSIIFTLTNVGKAPLNSATYTPTNTGPATWTQDGTTCTTSIAPSGSCTISGHFTSTNDGTGQFYIRAQGSYGSTNYSFVSLPLSYTVTSAPALAITPPSGDPNMTVLANGTSTATVVYTINNVGNDPALITNIGLQESNTTYKPTISTSAANACPSSGTLASGATCTITVTYGPIPATLTSNESGIAQLSIDYHGGTPDIAHSAQYVFNYNAVGNDSSVDIGTATATNLSGSGTQTDPFSGNASLNPMTISIDYTNNSNNYVMTGFSLDTSNLPYGVVVDPSSTCPTTSSSSISGKIESGAKCSLVLAIDRQLLTNSASGGSTVLNFATPTASWTTPLGFYSQSGSTVYANYLQPTIAFTLSNNNGNFESTMLTMTAANVNTAATLTGKVWGVKNWLESMPLNPSSNCTVNSSDYSLSCDLKTTTTGNVSYIMPNYLQSGENANIPLQFSTASGEYAYLNPGYTFINYSMPPAITRINLPQTGQLYCVPGTNYTTSCGSSYQSVAGTDGYGINSSTGVYIPYGVTWAYNGGSLTIPATRFSVSSDNCEVTDNLTGLIWLKDPSVASASVRNWATALTTANSGAWCGQTAGTWRLPNVNELASLVNQGVASSAAWLNSNGFSNVQASYYWSSSTYADNTSNAWSVNMGGGYVYYNNKANASGYVWPVRGGQ